MSEPAKVVSLTGEVLPDGEPVSHVIEVLEEALAAAKSGALVGFVIVSEWHDRTTSQRMAGFTRRYPVIGALEEAKHELLTSGD